jgi:hypothetical protein
MKRIFCLIILFLISISIFACAKDCPCSTNKRPAFDCIKYTPDVKFLIGKDNIIINTPNKKKIIKHKIINCFVITEKDKKTLITVQRIDSKKKYNL